MTRALAPWGATLPQPLDMFRREVDNLFDRVIGNDGGWSMPLVFRPSTNLSETEDAYEVTVELPGMKPEDFNVELQDGQLWISGEKKEEHEETGKDYRHMERRYGHFRRSIALPNAVDPEKVEAEFKDGVLKIHVAKSETAKPRRIEVKA